MAGGALLYDTFSFTLGEGEAVCGAACAWERRQDAPLQLRIALGEHGEPASPEALRAPTHNNAALLEEFIALPDEDTFAFDALPAPQPQPADASRRKSAPAAPGAAPPRRAALQAEAAPPWWPVGAARTLSRIRSPLLRLHQEIVDFCRFTEPTLDEAAARAAAVERVRCVVVSIWPGARLEVFGSFATGLYLPTSDIDAVILHSNCSSPADGLRALAAALTRGSVGHKIALVAKARIPIVKFEERLSAHLFDISFDVTNGSTAAEWMRQQMCALPPLRPLSLVLKAFLQQRELNEVYTGGVGSYALTVMLVAHLRTHPGFGEEPNLGVLLLDFLELYGRQLNSEAVGVTATSFLSKARRGWCDERRPELFAIEDPADSSNDLARNSFNARAIRTAFDHAHRLLSAPAQARTESLLGRVLHLDAQLLRRPRLQGQGAIAAVAASAHALAAPERGAARSSDEEEGGEEEGGGAPGAKRKQKQKNRKGKRQRAARLREAALAAEADETEEGEIEEGEVVEEAQPAPNKRAKKKRRVVTE